VASKVTVTGGLELAADRCGGLVDLQAKPGTATEPAVEILSLWISDNRSYLLTMQK